ncbi:MAG: carboxypeptidase regulatory-like domain-containing protein, partial [Lentisphaeria bacterium]|nr:carboxypeptidase regulatory-like domain-containing protein [Lentisphaeria bacterium]
MSGICRTAAGVPLDGATVWCNSDDKSAMVTSGPDGSYAFAGLQPGQFRMVAQKGPLRSAEEVLVLAPGEMRVVDLVLLPTAGSVSGVFLDGRGDPVPGGTVYLQDVTPEQETVTGADGSFTFGDVPSGTCSLRGMPPGSILRVDVEDVQVTVGQVTTVDLALAPHAGLFGVVMDCYGDPLEGATVIQRATMTYGNTYEQGRTTTGVDGRFAFPWVCPVGSRNVASQSVRAEGPGAGVVTQSVTVTPGPGDDVTGIELVPVAAQPLELFYSGYSNAVHPPAGWLPTGGNLEFVYVRVRPSAPGAMVAAESARCWVDGVPVSPDDLSTEALYAGIYYLCHELRYTPPSPGTLEGNHCVSFAAGDTAGNCTHFPVQFEGSPQPRLDPVVAAPTMVSPNHDGVNDSVTFTVSPSLPDDEVESISVFLAGKIAFFSPVGDGTWTAVWSTSGNVTSGMRMAVVSGEAKGLDPPDVVPVEIEILFDVDPPEMTLVTPLLTADPNGIQGTIADANGLEFLRCRTGGAEWMEAVVTEQSWHIDITLQEGVNDIDLWSRDTAGNDLTQTVFIHLDTEPPSVDLLWPDPGADNKPDVGFWAVVTDAGSGLNAAVLSLELDGEVVDTGAFSWSDGDWYGPLGALPDGVHQLTIHAADTVGNAAEQTAAFRTVTKPPVVVQRVPAPESTNTTFGLTVAVDAEDWSGHGLTGARLLLDGEEVAVFAAGKSATGHFEWHAAGFIPLGRRTLTCEITDALGQTTADTWTFTQDPQQDFGAVLYHVYFRDAPDA